MLSYLGVLLALGAILMLVGVLARAFRRYGLEGARHRLGAPLDVLHRTAIGPRQGIALVRVGSRVVLVSVGDGGVHHLMDVADGDAEQMLAQPAPSARAATPTMHAGTGKLAGAEIFRRAFSQALGLKRGAAILLAAAISSATIGATIAAPLGAQTTAPAAQGRAATLPAPSSRANPVTTSAQVVERLAPRMDLRLGQNGQGEGLRMNGTVGVVVMLGLLSLLPTLVLMTTGFTRILVVLYFLRQALGTQTSPPAPLIAALALILTGFVMAPTMTRVNQEALTPWLDGRIEQVEMLEKGSVPLREFMVRQTRPADLRRMVRLSRQPVVAGEPVPFVTLMAAFVISELRTAFSIGFALFLPFIVIDVVVASVLMSLGMFMLPPTMIALPFKLLLFVLVDGWGLIAQSLVAGFR